jgi:hypothetical protein
MGGAYLNLRVIVDTSSSLAMQVGIVHCLCGKQFAYLFPLHFRHDLFDARICAVSLTKCIASSCIFKTLVFLMP